MGDAIQMRLLPLVENPLAESPMQPEQEAALDRWLEQLLADESFDGDY